MNEDSRPSSPLVVYADGPNGPLPDPSQVEAISKLRDPQIVLGWVLQRPPWLDRFSGPVRTWMAGYGLGEGVRTGRVDAVPTRLSSVPGLLRGRSRPAVAVVAARRAGAGFRLVGGLGWAAAAAESAQGVVVELWEETWGIDGPEVPGTVVDVVARSRPPDPPPSYHHDATERTIAGLVASLIPPGSTVQWGPGSLCAAVIDAVATPVRVHSGLVTDELVALRDRGLLMEPAVAAYVWGGRDLQTMAEDGQLVLAAVDETHDPRRLAAINGFVACNTALQVGLDGAVNVEAVGGRTVAGPGGHNDFAEAATRSVGGRSIIALRSSHAGRSSIVARPEAVTTPRSDVSFVVTEHGVADLRDVSPQQRARRLSAIAAPEHRGELS